MKKSKSMESSGLNHQSKSSILLINDKMPTVVGILTFMSRINFDLSWVEHERSLITSGPEDRFSYHHCILRVPGTLIRIFLESKGKNQGSFTSKIFYCISKSKDHNCLYVQCDSPFSEYFQDLIISIRILHFYIIFLFNFEGPKGIPWFLSEGPRQHFGSMRLSILRQGKPCTLYLWELLDF